MMICKIPQHDAALMLQTLNKLSITPGLDNADMYVGIGLDNADMYVGIGLMLRNALDNAVEETEEEGTDDGRTDGKSDI